MDKKFIWSRPVVFLLLWLGIAFSYMLLNEIAPNLLIHHGSIIWILSCLFVIGAIAMLVLTYSLMVQKKIVTFKFHKIKHCAFLVLISIILDYILGVLSSIIYVAVMKVLGNSTEYATSSNGWNTVFSSNLGKYYLVSLCVFGPIIEEFLCRFLIIGPNPRGTYVVPKKCYYIRIFISIFIFAFNHILPDFTWSNLINLTSFEQIFFSMLFYLPSGSIYSYLYVHSQDIRLPIVTHAGSDIITLMMQFLG